MKKTGKYTLTFIKTSLFKNKPSISIGSFNLQGKLDEECQKALLASDLDQKNIDICALQETKVKDAFAADCGKYHFILLPRQSIWRGQGFAVRSHLRNSIILTEQVNDWIAVCRLKISDAAVLTIINCHAPTSDKIQERELFFESLSAVYRKYKSDALLISLL